MPVIYLIYFDNALETEMHEVIFVCWEQKAKAQQVCLLGWRLKCRKQTEQEKKLLWRLYSLLN
jgi:hypothetical protein